MEKVLTEAITQWGTFGILIAFAVWIIYTHIKDFLSNKQSSKDNKSTEKKDSDEGNNIILHFIESLSKKIDWVSNRMDNIENNIDNRISIIENHINGQSKEFINCLDTFYNNKIIDHNKLLDSQIKIGPDIHRILNKYMNAAGIDHIFMGSFHNGTSSLSGIPYCKFDIIAEKFSPVDVDRDIEFAFMYKDSDILRHDKLPTLVMQNNEVHYVIKENGDSELKDIDNIIYRRMIGRDIKQLALHVIRDIYGRPSGFVGGVKYNYDPIDTDEMGKCAKEIECLQMNSL